MNQSENQLFSIVTDNIPLTILSELIKEGELTVYDLNTKLYTIAQYRYALRKLVANNLLLSKKYKRKSYYSLASGYKTKIQSILACYLSFTPKNTLTFLQNFEGWAFRGKSALSYYVPFLSLVSSKYTISVRSIKEKEKLERFIPNIEATLDIKIQPTYFRNNEQYIKRIKKFPVLKPEIIFPGLLKSTDARVRLAAVFLLRYMNARKFFRYIQPNDRVYLTSVYLLLTLNEYLREQKAELRHDFMKTWFYNFDLVDYAIDFDKFLKSYQKIRGMKSQSSDVFRNLLKTAKKQQQKYTKWDRAADLVPDRLVSFNPIALNELISIEA